MENQNIPDYSCWSCLSPWPVFTYWLWRWISDTFFSFSPRRSFSVLTVEACGDSFSSSLGGTASSCRSENNAVSEQQSSNEVGPLFCASCRVEGTGENISGSAPLFYKWESWSCPVFPDCPPTDPNEREDLHNIIALWAIPRRVSSAGDMAGCVVNSLLVLLEQLGMCLTSRGVLHNFKFGSVSMNLMRLDFYSQPKSYPGG